MTARTMRNLRASHEVSDPMGASRSTGRVSVSAVPDWLKGDTLVTSSITPKQARRLAIDLLLAAEKAEEGSLR